MEMPPPPTVLVNGVATSPVDYNASQIEVFTLENLAGERVRCRTLSDSGDVNLYLRWDAEPSWTAYDCFSGRDDSNEDCVVNDPGGTRRVWIMVYAYTEVNNHIGAGCVRYRQRWNLYIYLTCETM